MKYNQLFQDFNKLNVLIIGDIMIDSYYFGKVERLSPEAPVPVVNVVKKENRLGGAGNVALNILALGATPILCSVAGKDTEGELLKSILSSNKLTTDAIVFSDDRPTTIKTRVIGNNHQLVRIDQEEVSDLTTKEDEQLLSCIEQTLPKVDVVILEDYNKGVLHKNNISKIINLCIKAEKPITVDPKKANFTEYKNVNLFKPNLKELKEGLNLDVDLKSKIHFESAIDELFSVINPHSVMVTMSEMGVFIKNKYNQKYIPAHIRNISDVSGAGDTVISVAACCLALNQDIETIASLSNMAGGLVCEETGVVPINKEKLLMEANELL